MSVVGEAVDAVGLTLVAAITRADLVLLDSKLVEGPVEPLLKELLALEPRPTVVVMSTDLHDGRSILKAGADAFVSKGDQPEWLLEALRHYAERARTSSVTH